MATGTPLADVESALSRTYTQESRRIFATLVRLLGDFELAEESMHDAFELAVKKWPLEGVPSNPRSWIVTAARFRGIDQIRRRDRFRASQQELALLSEDVASFNRALEAAEVEDDRLRLIFTCCHPALAREVQVALTLREVCGLSTEQVAAAFLVSVPAMAQRLVRGKAKIKAAGIPYAVPPLETLPERLEAVLAVVYLVFNQGYSDSGGDSALCGEAIRLTRLLLELLREPEIEGLLALMLLHESRRPARLDSRGDLVLLESQDRSLWDAELIAEGLALTRRALSAPDGVGPYALQAAISAVHARASSAEGTDWSEIVYLYDLLKLSTPSPVVDLNRAVALAFRDGPAEGLAKIDELLGQGQLTRYHLAHAARADLLRRLGRLEEARQAYETALSLTSVEVERRFLSGRLQEL